MSRNTDEFNNNIKSYSDAIFIGIQDGMRHPVPWVRDMAMLMADASNDAREIFGIKSTDELNMEAMQDAEIMPILRSYS